MGSNRTGVRRSRTRHTSRPRKVAASAGSFTGMLAKLGLATATVKATRGRR